MAIATLRIACLAALFAAAAAPCSAESFASSASSAGSASSGSVSDSIQGSSNASSPDKKVAEGDYRVTTIAAAERPGMLRVTLAPTQARAGAGEFVLVLPQEALGTQGLAEGAIVSTRHRAYGLEFARAETREAFFLVLADDWHRELAARPVSL